MAASRTRNAADTSGTHVWLVLMKAFRSMKRHAAITFDDADLGFSDFTILEVLLHKGPLQVNDVGRRIHLTSGAITVAVDRLEARGLVVREPDANDRRARVVTLTTSGRSLITKVFGEHKVRLDAAGETLTVAERVKLVELLKKLGLGADALLDAM